MIRAYDDNGNVVDLVKWQKQIKLDAIDEFVNAAKGYNYTIGVNQNRTIYKWIDRIAKKLKEKSEKCET